MIDHIPEAQGASNSAARPAPSTAAAGRVAIYAAIALVLSAICGARVAQQCMRTAAQDDSSALYQRAMDHITIQLDRARRDPRQSVQLAHLYLARARLMAASAYEVQHHSDPDGQTEPNDEAALREYTLWCRRYLAADPGHGVSDTVRTARLALRRGLPPWNRRCLLITEATALCYLGRHQEEVAALRQVPAPVRNSEDFRRRLSHARAEAGRLMPGTDTLR
jgi:hypothetical protein